MIHPLATLWHEFTQTPAIQARIAKSKAAKKKSPYAGPIKANCPGWKSFKKWKRI